MKLKDYIIIALLGLFLFNFFNPKVIETNTTTYDTIQKVLYFPSVTGVYLDSLLKAKKETPPKVKTYRKEYLAALESGKDTLSVLNRLLDSLIDAKTIREYSRVYEDSSYTATINIKTEGKLIESRFKHVLKPRKVQYTEIHSTTKLKPRYTFLLGGGASLGIIGMPSIGFGAGLLDSRGRLLTLKVGTNQEIQVGYYMTAFTKW